MAFPAFKGFDTDVPLTRQIIQQAMDDPSGPYECAGRYFHNLAQSEIALCESMGFGLWLIDEVRGQDQWAYWSGGHDAGVQRGKAALTSAQRVGLPVGQFICLAVDLDVSLAQQPIVDQFLVGYLAGLMNLYKLLVYGEGLVLSHGLPDGSKGYLACAGGWTGTRGFPSAQAAIVQHAPSMHWGIDVDLCDVNDPTVVWFPGEAGRSDEHPTVEPPPLLADPFASLPSEPKTLQNFLRGRGLYGGQIDGLLGPQSKAAIGIAVAQHYGQK